MHGGAVSLAAKFVESDAQPDLIMADDMLDLTAFAALTRKQTHGVPLALYMHENQLTYPLPADPTTGAMRRNHNERDHHYVFINYSSMLLADHIFFNSQYHLDSWFEAVPKYLRHYPDHREHYNIALTREKSSVLPVGINLPRTSPLKSQTEPPLILWNQRWEYDKNPDAFFAALGQLKAQGIAFRLAVCGENFSRKPIVFESASEQFADEIVHFGFAERATYDRLLAESDIVVSTAHHEFFGISIVEAMLHGVCPILPNRLSYPELVPAHLHESVLYKEEEALVGKLVAALSDVEAARGVGMAVGVSAEKYTWPNLISQYDSSFANLVDASTKSG